MHDNHIGRIPKVFKQTARNSKGNSYIIMISSSQRDSDTSIKLCFEIGVFRQIGASPAKPRTGALLQC
jgi:hypothetical protein